MNRAEKAQLIEQLRETADKAQIAVVTEFKGMTVEEMTSVREALYKIGVRMEVVKNTLARIALTDGRHGVIADRFKENNAVVWGVEDPVAAAKTLIDYTKANPKTKLAIKYGSLDGAFLDLERLKSLAALPGKDELRAKLLGTMLAVPQGFVCLLANVPRGLLNVLTALKDKKNEESAAA